MSGDEASTGERLVRGATDATEVTGRYAANAEGYDADLAAWSYRAPVVVAEIVRTRCPTADSVLDVGCGTGMIGQSLRARGYAGRLWGLDISQASLRVAEQSGAYDVLEPGDLRQPLDVESGGVDALVCVGVMTYLPDVEATWRVRARGAPGGVVVVTQREEVWASRHCRDVVARLEAEGVWTALDVTGPAPYLTQADGAMAELGCYYSPQGPAHRLGPS